MNETGYVKIYRSFLEWEWHDSQSMVTVFIHCILLANWKDKRHHGQTVKRGSFLTSSAALAHICGLSANTVRKCLKRLQDTGEIDMHTSNKGTLITVKNYANYQQIENLAVQNVTSELHNNLHNKLHNNLHTTNKERKKEEKIKKYIKKVKVKEELPDYYNADPVRITDPEPATAEEVEQTRKAIMKGKQNKQ